MKAFCLTGFGSLREPNGLSKTRGTRRRHHLNITSWMISLRDGTPNRVLPVCVPSLRRQQIARHHLLDIVCPSGRLRELPPPPVRPRQHRRRFHHRDEGTRLGGNLRRGLHA